jgi:hypothetical protein
MISIIAPIKPNYKSTFEQHQLIMPIILGCQSGNRRLEGGVGMFLQFWYPVQVYAVSQSIKPQSEQLSQLKP